MSGILKVIVLFSGRGSNLESLILGSAKYKNYSIIESVTDNPSAQGIEIAKQHGVSCKIFELTDAMKKDDLKNQIFSYVEKQSPDLIALAGFMQIVPKWFVDKWSGKMINIHPSLLPNFPGLKTHQRAIDAKVLEHGCTVHYVDSGIDTGLIIAQSKCAVLPIDTPETLEEKVLKLEHELYPKVLSELARTV